MSVRSGLLLCLLLATGRVAAVELITRDEAQTYQTHIVPSRDEVPADDRDAPRIVVFQPDLQASVRTPFPIEIFFKPADGARIAWPSLRVLYGSSQFDITSRIRQVARIADNSLFIQQAEIPPGTHRLTLKIADENKRTARRDLVIVVRN